jgi:dipeptidyl aminopeptidase/acylaminoacyl peptidase
MMTSRQACALLVLCASAAAGAQDKPFDAAAAFGARPSVIDMTLSPDGKRVAYIVPTKGPGTALYTLGVQEGARAQPALLADGDPFRLTHCDWLSSERLVCEAYGLRRDSTGATGELLPITRLLAVDTSGANARVLSTQPKEHTHGYLLNGGDIIDWLPDQNGAVLMTREYLPDEHTGSHVGSSAEGLGVDRIDTRSLAITSIEPANRNAFEYLTDGHGTVRIMGTRQLGPDERDTGVLTFHYREPASRIWKPLSSYRESDRSGFNPLAVDRDLNVAYGVKKLDGRLAIYSLKLDDSLKEQLIYARPDVDVSDLLQIGRAQRVFGARYVTQAGYVSYFDPQMEQLMNAVAKAVPQHHLRIAGASLDESKLLLLAGSDTDAGVYYLFDRATHRLDTFLVVRRELEGVTLATVKSVSYPADDAVLIPAYLTLPPGRESAKGLPAIVLPHGGPSDRDEWGFNWVAQFYAARGYAVLQPNYRGSSGYGDGWSLQNGFKSWSAAIADVLAGGRWLVSQGIADPDKLAIVGGSYGGYAALQSAVVDPHLFKAVVAIAPVTDLAALKEEHRYWSDFAVVSDFVGSGANMHEGSPAEHAGKIQVPVLLFHGALDRNVAIEESRRMAARLKAAGRECELVSWDKLDHQLDDSEARTEMLRKSDAFLRKALGM